MLSPSLDSYFLEVKKIKTVKKILKLRFLDNFFKGEGDKCDQEDWNSLIHLELLHLVQLPIIQKWKHPFHWKQPPKPLYEVKQLQKLWFLGFFLKQKRKSAIKKIE